MSVFCVLRTAYRLKYADQVRYNMSGKDDEEKFSRSDQVDLYNGEGDNVAPRWFILDIAVERFAQRVFGEIGVSIWRGSHSDIDDANAEEHAWKLHTWIKLAKGSKEAAAAYVDEEFWTAMYQHQYRVRKMRTLYNYLYDHSGGAFRTWLEDYEPAQIDEIRKAAMSEFGRVNRGTVQQWESEFDSGMPDSGQIAFPIGVDIKAKIQQLKRRQRLLTHMCPPSRRVQYPYAGVSGDQKRASIYLVHAHVFREVLNECVREAQTRARTGGVEVPHDVNATDYNNEWQPEATHIERAMCAKAEQDKVTETMLGGKKSNGGSLPLMMNSGGHNNSGNEDYHPNITCNRCNHVGHYANQVDVCQAVDVNEQDKEWLDMKRASYALSKKKMASGSSGGSQNNSGFTNDRVCYQFQNTGKCNYQNCKFAHVRGNGNGKGKGRDGKGKGRGKGARNRNRNGGGGRGGGMSTQQFSSMIFDNIKSASKRLGKGKKKREAKDSDEESSDADDNETPSMLSIMNEAQAAVKKKLKTRGKKG